MLFSLGIFFNEDNIAKSAVDIAPWDESAGFFTAGSSINKQDFFIQFTLFAT